MNINRHMRLFSSLLLGCLICTSVWSQRDGTAGLFVQAGQASTPNPLTTVPTPTSSGPAACIHINNIDSLDGLDDPDNVVLDFFIGAGNELTGLSWDINIATAGVSWLSDATIQFSSSDGSADPNAFNLAPGFGQNMPGAMDFSSNGIVPFASIPMNNVVVNADGILRLQFFESFDDVSDVPDAIWNEAANSSVCPGIFLQCSDQISCGWVVDLAPPPPIPSLSSWGIWVLLLLLLSAGLISLTGWRDQRG